MHPLFGADLPSLVRLLAHNGGVSHTSLPTAIAVGCSALGRVPFTLGERGLVSWRKRRSAPMPAPIFIVGHWRSGTTHLYNLLTRSTFGYVTPIAAGMPNEFLTLGRWLEPLLVKMLPKTRYVDQVAVRPDSPQEDEIPLGSMNPISFYHGIYFPKHFDRHFRRSMFLEGCSAAEIDAWQAALVRLMEKSWLFHGKPLIIKNPTYSSRMLLLRHLFPDARFIHIYRNPYEVFRSTKRFYRTLLERFAWQPFDHVKIDHYVFEGYERLMERVEADRRKLPGNRFVDLRFEDLEAQPIEEIKKIFEQLELGEIGAIEPSIGAYLKSVAGFEKTAFEPCAEEQAMVLHHWGSLFERFGYALP